MIAVASSFFDLGGELRQIALAQALAGLPAALLGDRPARMAAYRAIIPIQGRRSVLLLSPVTVDEDAEAQRRHALRLSAFSRIGAAA